MNFVWKNLSTIIIIILVGIIFLQRACQPEPPNMENYIRIGSEEYELLKHKRDTIWKTETFYMKGDPIPGKTIYKEIPADVDTAAILKDYFAVRPYSETVNIGNDSTDYGTVTVSEKVSENKLFDRKYKFDVNIPTYTETFVVKEKPVNKWYIGGGMNFDKVNLISNVYGGILIQNKRDHIYGLNLGITNTGDQVTPFIGGSMYWKIRFKKKTTQYSKLEVEAAQQILNNLSN